MISEMKKGGQPYGKANRWLGFIQGTMIARGLLTVPQEREMTRGFFEHEKNM